MVGRAVGDGGDVVTIVDDIAVVPDCTDVGVAVVQAQSNTTGNNKRNSLRTIKYLFFSLFIGTSGEA
jgi:hypothetical protein